MLASLDLENFRAFEAEQLELRPITVFLGPNNSGKSSILAALRLLVQTLHSLDYQVPLLLNGALGDFGTYKDVIYENDRRHRLHIGVGFRMPARQRPRTARARARQDADTPSSYWDTKFVPAHLALKYRYRTRRRELILDEAALSQDDTRLLTLRYSDDAGRHQLINIAGEDVPPAVRARITAEQLDLHHFLPRVYPYYRGEDKGQTLLDEKAIQASLRQAYELSVYLWRLLEVNVEYVGPMRLPPQRTYQHTGEAHSRVGGSGENWAAMLTRDIILGDSSGMVNLLTPWLDGAGLASAIEVVWLSDRQYELRLTHPITGESQNIADVGQGNSQVLPVLVAGLHLDAGSVFMVEEPEIHLHPHAQAELGDFFVDLHDRGVQSLIETHSEYLVLRLQQHVASGRLDPAHIRFYYVYAAEGAKRILAMDLDRDATFKSHLPDGFFPERVLEPRRLAKERGASKLRRMADK